MNLSRQANVYLPCLNCWVFVACRFLWSVTPVHQCTTAPLHHCWRSRFVNHSNNCWQSLTQLTCGCGCSHNHRLRALWVYFDTTWSYAASMCVCVWMCVCVGGCQHQQQSAWLYLVCPSTATSWSWPVQCVKRPGELAKFELLSPVWLASWQPAGTFRVLYSAPLIRKNKLEWAANYYNLN